jgi:hypothetical protein
MQDKPFQELKEIGRWMSESSFRICIDIIASIMHFAQALFLPHRYSGMSDEPEPETTPIGKAKARPKARTAASRAAVAQVAAELHASGAGPSTVPLQVTGPFPPRASSTGRKYYLFRPLGEEAAFIVAGQELTLTYLGGSWVGHAYGRVPQGLATLRLL